MRRARRGFSMLEVLVVVAIVAVFSALAFPKISESINRSRFNGAVRAGMGALNQARSLAISRSTVNGVVAEGAGIRVLSDTTYEIFIDPDDDDTNNNDVRSQLINLMTEDKEGLIRLIEPAPGTALRFRRDGSTQSARLTFEDRRAGLRRVVLVTAAGFSSME